MGCFLFFLLEGVTELTDAAAGSVLNVTVSTPLLRVAAEGAGRVGAREVCSTVMGSQSTLINVCNMQEHQSVKILCKKKYYTVAHSFFYCTR